MKIVRHNEEIIFEVKDTTVRLRFHDEIEPGHNKVNVNLSGEFQGAFALIGDYSINSERRWALRMALESYVRRLIEERENAKS